MLPRAAERLRERVAGGNLGLRDPQKITEARNLLFASFGGRIPKGERRACLLQLAHGAALDRRGASARDDQERSAVRRSDRGAPPASREGIGRAASTEIERDRITHLRGEVSNLTEAIASGALRTSKALAERLAAAEAELEQLVAEKAPARLARVTSAPVQLLDHYRRLVASLEAELSRDVHKGRTILRRIVGSEIQVLPHQSGKHLVARIGLDMQELVQSAANSEIFVVAGACTTNIRRRRALLRAA
jgi:hypothetical protein